MTTQSTSKHTPSKHTAWQQHIDAWQASGLSQTTYCKTQDIKAHRFSYWKLEKQTYQAQRVFRFPRRKS